jgi:hypothetical protein
LSYAFLVYLVKRYRRSDMVGRSKKSIILAQVSPSVPVGNFLPIPLALSPVSGANPAMKTRDFTFVPSTLTSVMTEPPYE